MWDQRYRDADYVYGKQANDFLVENYSRLPKGKILSLAEGEGRNAVFLAQQGYAVTAVDSSQVGLDKAQKLAQEYGVKIDTILADINEFEITPNTWEGIISIFCPLSTQQQQLLYPKIVAGLKPKGVYLVEAYRPEQLAYGTGGGSSADQMTTQASLEHGLRDLEFIQLESLEREVIEGKFHTGLAAVIQAIALKH